MMKGRNAWLRVTVMLLWITGILFPFYSMRWFSPPYKTVFDWVFRTHASHVLMHTFLYAVLAWLIVSLIPRRVCERSPTTLLCALAGTLAIAILQEGIQLLCEQAPVVRDELFDILVDLNGGILGASLYLQLVSRHAAAPNRTQAKKPV